MVSYYPTFAPTTAKPTFVPTKQPTFTPTFIPTTSSPTRPTATPSTSVPTSTYPTLSPNVAFIISTIAGTGTGSFSGDDSDATAATLNYPYGVALDSSGLHFLLLFLFLSHLFRALLGNVYISDTSNNRIRKITVSTGIISTIAGSAATGYFGDGGAATSAAVNGPRGVAIDLSGI